MKNVQEKVWMVVAKSAYQLIGASLDTACLSIADKLYLPIEVQALGKF